MGSFYAAVLAAGAGKRMKSENAKVTHSLCGKPMIQWVIDAVKGTGIEETVVVTGFQEEQVRACISGDNHFVNQSEQLGTGHAMRQTLPFLEGKQGTCLVLYGDIPLISTSTLEQILKEHNRSGKAMTVLTALLDDPAGYGRIVRDDRGKVQAIVEHRDADTKQRNIKEINTGIYCFEVKWLTESLKRLNNNNDQKEYYLTDTLSLIRNEGGEIGTMLLGCHEEMMGINDRVQLDSAQKILNRRLIEKHMRNGVTFLNPDTNMIEDNVKIGRDTVIYPGSILQGDTIIGENCVIGPYSTLDSVCAGHHVTIMHSVARESSIDDETNVGPFAYIRPGSKIGKNVKVGDFVEVKKSVIGNNTKISHLTYVGDAEIGKNVNMGCGVVVVNYDGKTKHKTIVGDNSFIGCNVNLVSPVEIKSNAYIAAGSTITEEVPEYSLAIARSRQSIISDWVIRKGKIRGTESKG